MPQYAQYSKQYFPTRQQAEVWAEDQKRKLKAAELGVPKIDISYVEVSGGNKQWEARMLMPVD